MNAFELLVYVKIFLFIYFIYGEREQREGDVFKYL